MTIKPPANETWEEVAALTPEQSEQWEQINLKENTARKTNEDLLEALVQTATRHAQDLFNAKRAWWKAFAEANGMDIRAENLRIVPQDDGTFKVVKVTKTLAAVESQQKTAAN